jgi:hypothetical protein
MRWFAHFGGEVDGVLMLVDVALSIFEERREGGREKQDERREI